MTVPTVRISGDLPSGAKFAASISRDAIAVRVGDRVCLAAPRWMTADQAQAAADALREAAS